MRILLKLLMIFIFLNPGFCIDGKFERIIPENFKLQTAGYVGYISLAAGYSFYYERVQMDLFYGYVPKSIGGKDIHTIALKNSFVPKRYFLKEIFSIAPTFGVILNVALGDEYWIWLPEKYPKQYYWLTAIHFIPFIGLKFRKDCTNVKGIEMYYELGALDILIYDYFRQDYIKLKDILNSAMGITLYL